MPQSVAETMKNFVNKKVNIAFYRAPDQAVSSLRHLPWAVNKSSWEERYIDVMRETEAGRSKKKKNKK